VVVRLVAKVFIDTMEPTVLYHIDGASEERIALLTGIIQLVSAALEMSDSSSSDCAPRFMKSERGVIGYCTSESFIVICEGDNEGETKKILKTVVDGKNITDAQLLSNIEKAATKRGNEIGSLWQ
jgi:hypothetical protein